VSQEDNPTSGVRLMEDTIAAIVGRPGTIPVLIADPDEHGRRYGVGDSLEEAQAFSRRMLASLQRAQWRDLQRSLPAERAAVRLPRLRQPRRCAPGGRPRGRRTRTTRGSPRADGEPHPARSVAG
jgi:hypothetical protein